MELSPLSLQPGIFISNRNYLSDRPGGVQLCTREYQQTLTAAGFDLSIVDYETTRALPIRLRRKLWPRPYEGRLPPDLTERIIAAAQARPGATLFLNQGDLAPVAHTLKQRLGPTTPIVLLSHGLESTDLFHSIRTRDVYRPFNQVTGRDRHSLAHSLILEWQQRQWIDQVFCLSAFELELERWLGARRVTWLPRLVQAHPLPWQPNADYLGFVGTLNHSPNREGLLLFLEALQAIAPAQLRLRIVGGPTEAGIALARQFPVVDYLGPLDDAALRQEARHWSAMIHPLFCYPRGCSTKLAIALGWQIPVLTTEAGCRGYQGAAQHLQLAETPQQLARWAVQVGGDRSVLESLQQQSVAVVEASPQLPEIARLIRSQLFPVSLALATMPVAQTMSI